MKKIKVLATALCMCTMLSAPLTSFASTGATEPVSIVSDDSLKAAGTVYTVIVDGLRLRAQAGTSGTILGLLYKGNTVRHLGETKVVDGNVWLRIQVIQGNGNDGKIGWIAKYNLS